MDEEQNDLWLEEESEENAEEIPWAESILDFADWNQDEDAPVCDEELEEESEVFPLPDGTYLIVEG